MHDYCHDFIIFHTNQFFFPIGKSIMFYNIWGPRVMEALKQVLLTLPLNPAKTENIIFIRKRYFISTKLVN